MRAMRDPKSWLRLLSAAAGSAVIAALGCTAAAQTGGGQPGDEYTFHWAVKTSPDTLRRRGDLQARIDLAESPFQRDTALLYASQCGRFPFAGPHQVAASPSWMREHLAKVERDLARHVPQRDFAGLIVIDYERWNLLWDRTRNVPSREGPSARDDDYQDDWRDHVRSNHPELLRGLSPEEQEGVFASTFEQAARDFYTATFNRVKELRPRARVSFFGYPTKLYRSQETPRGVIGYGDLSHEASRLNDRLAWLWETVDFLAPNVYCRFVSVEDRRPEADFENTPDEDAEFVRTNIAEAVRLAAGKPVYAVVHYRYQRDDDHPLNRRMLEPVNLEHQLRMPGEAGADGVILWGGLASDDDLHELAEYLRTSLLPEAQAADSALSHGGEPPSGEPRRREQEERGRPPAEPEPPAGSQAGSEPTNDPPSAESAEQRPKRGGRLFTRDEAREAMRRYRETVRQSQNPR